VLRTLDSHLQDLSRRAEQFRLHRAIEVQPPFECLHAHLHIRQQRDEFRFARDSFFRCDDLTLQLHEAIHKFLPRSIGDFARHLLVLGKRD
jgi:hypothetical protein